MRNPSGLMVSLFSRLQRASGLYALSTKIFGDETMEAFAAFEAAEPGDVPHFSHF